MPEHRTHDLIGTLARQPAPTFYSRGRTYRDYTGVIVGGASCRAVLDVALADRVIGEKAIEEADFTFDTEVHHGAR